MPTREWLRRLASFHSCATGAAGRATDSAVSNVSRTLFASADYQYDEQGRIWKVSIGAIPTREYHYDANGNRKSSDLAGTVVATYDNQDRMLMYNGASYGYAPNGERKRRTRTDGSVDEYQYDAVGNLSHVTRNDGVSIDYVVDAMNRRIAKKVNGSPVARYIYRNGLSLAAILDGAGNLMARFVYATMPNAPDFMVLRDGTVYKFINDQRGSPRIIVNTATGAIAQQTYYDEFGNSIVTNSPGFDPSVQPFGFAGGLYDPDTGLVRFGARDYEAETGRWLAKDPALFGGAQSNLYVYAGNDPVNRVDRNGLWGFAIGGSGGLGFGFPLGGSEDGGSGVVVAFDSTGITVAGYTTQTTSIGAGAYLGFGLDLTGFRGDLSNFAGTSYGGKLDIGLIEKGDFKVSSVISRGLAALCGGLGGGSGSSTPSATLSAGIGGGLYVGATRSTTTVEGYNFTSGTLVSY